MFYDYEFYTATVEEIRNEIGEVEKTIVKKDLFIGDMQPIDESTKAKQWGNDTQASITIYTDTNLNVGDYVYSDDKLLEVEKVIDWVIYKIYALKWAKYEN